MLNVVFRAQVYTQCVLLKNVSFLSYSFSCPAVFGVNTNIFIA